MKKYLFLIPLFFIFIFPRGVFARVNRVMTLPSDYSDVLTNVNIPQGGLSVDYTGWTNSTAFIRLYNDDTFEPSKTYTANFGFCVFTWDKDSTAIFGNSVGGWNISGGYVSTSPAESSVVDYDVTTINGRTRYQRCYTQRWEFNTPSSISYPFFQIGLSPNNQSLAKFTWWNWSIVQKDTSSADITNSITNNTTTIINNNNQNTQNIINSQQETTNAINDINNSLTDTTITGDSIGSKFADIYLISDTPITDLLTMPLHLLQKIYNSIQTECSPYTLPFDFGFSSLNGYTISLPCLNLGHENRLGRVVWGYIDDLCCIFMIYNIFKMVIYFYDSWTSLKDNFDWLIDPSTRGLPY